MTKAEKAALNAHPPVIVSFYPSTVAPIVKRDANEEIRKVFQEGYEQAEKDLALSWEDMKLAFGCVNEAIDNCEGKTKQEIFEDALRRFNEQRRK